MSSELFSDPDYVLWLTEIKEKIKEKQVRAALQVNTELLGLYWELGNAITEKQTKSKWGDKIINQLSKDLLREFPEMKGFSQTNLKYIRKWFQFYAIGQQAVDQLQIPASTVIGQQAVDQPKGRFEPLNAIPWGHHIQIITKCGSVEEATFYLQQTANNNWSRNVLIHQIESDLYKRQGKLQHNFGSTLPAAHGDLARELFKDPYKFDLLQLTAKAHERDLENALVEHVITFLTEMGKGFSLVGRQVHFEKGGQDYYIDLLLYHLKLHCYVVLELKIGEFKPEYAGKLNFYLSAVDDDFRTPEDKQSIGLILCKSKNKVTVEYALRDVNKPMGVAEYQLTKAIPKELKGELPSIESLERELEREIEIPKRPLDDKLSKLKDMIGKINREPLQKQLGKEDIILLFDTVLPEIITRLKEDLKEAIIEFKSTSITRSINDRFDRNTLTDLEDALSKENVYRIGLNIQFNGFIKGGTRSFNIWNNPKIELLQSVYHIKLNDDKVLFEKLYHQKWDDRDYTEVVECFAGHIMDEINFNIGRIIESDSQ